MKDRNITIISIIMICITLLCGVYLFYNVPMDDSIKNIPWYSYEIKTGAYSVFKINEKDISFLNESKDYSNCQTYNYNSKKKAINLDCGKTFYIKDITKDKLILKINESNVEFYKTIEEALEHEFKERYGKSIIEYEKEKEQILEILKINYEKILELYDNEQKSIVVTMGDKCNNIDCTLVLEILEKWNVDSNNVYYIDSNSLNEVQVNKIESLNKKMENQESLINGNYPGIIVLGNKDIYEYKPFKCKGLDCTAWKNYAKDL